MPDNLSGNASIAKRRNWPLVWGFLLSLAALLSYLPIFSKYPLTNDFPWVNLLLFAASLSFLFVGVRRAFGQSGLYRGKIVGPVLSVLSLAVLGFFCLSIFYFARQLPASSQSPRVGQKAPDFTLADVNGNIVSLAAMLSASPAASRPSKGVLLIFYRGYW